MISTQYNFNFDTSSVVSNSFAKNNSSRRLMLIQQFHSVNFLLSFLKRTSGYQRTIYNLLQNLLPLFSDLSKPWGLLRLSKIWIWNTHQFHATAETLFSAYLQRSDYITALVIVDPHWLHVSKIWIPQNKLSSTFEYSPAILVVLIALVWKSTDAVTNADDHINHKGYHSVHDANILKNAVICHQFETGQKQRILLEDGRYPGDDNKDVEKVLNTYYMRVCTVYKGNVLSDETS